MAFKKLWTPNERSGLICGSFEAKVAENDPPSDDGYDGYGLGFVVAKQGASTFKITLNDPVAKCMYIHAEVIGQTQHVNAYKILCHIDYPVLADGSTFYIKPVKSTDNTAVSLIHNDRIYFVAIVDRSGLC